MTRFESQHTEWKESWRDDLLRWACGFANAEGGRFPSAKVRLTSPHPNAATTTAGDDRLVLRGQVETDGIRFEAIAKVESSGWSITPKAATRNSPP